MIGKLQGILVVTDRFPWLESPVKTLLGMPVVLQMLGQIAARSI